MLNEGDQPLVSAVAEIKCDIVVHICLKRKELKEQPQVLLKHLKR